MEPRKRALREAEERLQQHQDKLAANRQAIAAMTQRMQVSKKAPYLHGHDAPYYVLCLLLRRAQSPSRR